MPARCYSQIGGTQDLATPLSVLADQFVSRGIKVKSESGSINFVTSMDTQSDRQWPLHVRSMSCDFLSCN